MKPSTLLSLCFLFFPLTTDLPLAFSKNREQVNDTNGNPIFAGGRYYIKPAKPYPHGGGGVRLGKTGKSTCPVTVLQDYSQAVNGLPVKFSIATEGSTGDIFLDTSLNISFEEGYKPDCAGSSKWVLLLSPGVNAGGKEHNLEGYVGIGGVEDHPGEKFFTGSFMIRTCGFEYCLMFCFTSIPPPDSICLDIRAHDDENGRLLVTVIDDIFQVVFVNVDTNGIRSVV